ncbi:MAG: hypothetical protein GTO45_25950 [Candidatus Aminicenantes bacterium]|nr:hypothetical protein [Candidatus Aminicenantes bacterium]NIM82181.1 hypothetical protein [Candidatus Aminicenantes bacterium]NIN21583.1 hypothetical protein [Candidatus Aminicenantes bacterium]NIN45392.1 hypothetical protein [Candidatus Aminicenantes bacterium]NIN88213.1 hypothetical protein [Candidatus Aminicenantes bacterium]
MFTMKHFIIIIVISLFLGISWAGSGSPAYDNMYEKVWDSGNILPNPAYKAAVCDLDLDGKTEIIVSDNSKTYDGKIFIFENSGDDSYQLVWNSVGIITGNDCYISIAVGDLDKDGKREIITMDHQPLSGKIKAYVLENTGDNNYRLAWDSGDTLFGEDGGTALFIGDADNDGKSEIIVGTGWGQANKGKIYVFENTGDDAYEEVWNSGSALIDTVLQGAVGDLDKDGKKEIIVGSGDIDPQIHVFENTGDNSYALVWDSGSFFNRLMCITIGDADSDGKEEIIAGSVDKLVCIFENAGDNSYQLAWISPVMPHYMHFVSVGDQDNDGKKEIIAPCMDNIVYLFENTGDDTYEIVWNSGNLLGGIAIQTVPGDADGDGKGEIIVPCYDKKVYVFEHPGPAVITVEIDIKPGSWPNAITPRSKGVIPVAILTTDNFDATNVDPLSVKFGPGEAAEAHGKGHIEDVDNDGDLDMVLHFKTQETGIQHGYTNACLTGKTMDGKSIEGCDDIVTVGKGKK